MPSAASLTSVGLATFAVAICLDWLPLGVGPWPGISLGLAAALLARQHLRQSPVGAGRWLAWGGLSAGGLAAAVGTLLYLGLVWGTGRLV